MTLDAISPLAKTIPESLFMIYQMTFAVITVALVAGSVADRMRFSAFLLFCVFWLLLVYVPIAHWVWGGGFLGSYGVLDFAGGTVVHINAGVAGLVAAYVLGKRRGYGTENLAPHDLSLAVIGTGLLWVGWFGFNGGSALGANSRAAMAIVATHLAACAGALHLDGAGVVDARQAVGARHDLRRGRGPRHHHAGVGLRAADGRHADRLDRRRRLLLGLHLAQAALGYDDSLDVFGVHGIGGMTGTLLAGVFAVGAVSVSPEYARRRPRPDRGQSAAGAGRSSTASSSRSCGPAWRPSCILKVIADDRAAAGTQGGRDDGARRQPARRGAAIEIAAYCPTKR